MFEAHVIRRRSAIARLLAFVATLSAARESSAQSAFAEAEQLFRDGKALMAEKRYSEACVAFQTSLELDPTVSTKLNLADCREKNQQFATAWGLFIDVEYETRGNAKQRGLNDTARTRSKALEGRLSYLTISVPDESRVEGLTITRNGNAVEEGLWNRAVPVDGGTIVVAGQAPGHEEWATTIDMPIEGGRVSVDVPRFKALRALVSDDPVAEPANSTRSDAPSASTRLDRSERRGDGLSGRRKASIVVSGLGLGALALGTWAGLESNSLDEDAFALCPEPEVPCADAAEASALSARAVSRARVANAAFGASVVALVGAIVLWVTGDDSSFAARTSWSPHVGDGVAGVRLRVVY